MGGEGDGNVVVLSNARGEFTADCDPAAKYTVRAEGGAWSSKPFMTSVPNEVTLTVSRSPR